MLRLGSESSESANLCGRPPGADGRYEERHHSMLSLLGKISPMPEALPDARRLGEIVAAMAGQPVLICADLVADRFIHGSPKRISREAPVLILRHDKDVFVPGGGANAVANVAALGGEPLPLGAVGDDESGRALVAAFAHMGVAGDGIATIDGYHTPTKVRVLGGGKHSIKQQIVRYDVEDHIGGEVDLAAEHAGALASWSGRARVAVLSDYGYGAVTPERVAELRAHLAPDSVVLCDSRYRLAEYAGIDGATPNEEEAEAIAGVDFNDDGAALGKAGDRLRRQLGARFLLITRGSLGMSLFAGRRVAHIPIHGSDQVADVTGAGDTVIGAFALALAAGATAIEAALLANYAGGIVVHKLGTATATPVELAAALADGAPIEGVRWAES